MTQKISHLFFFSTSSTVKVSDRGNESTHVLEQQVKLVVLVSMKC